MGADAKFYNGVVWGNTRNTGPIFRKVSQKLHHDFCRTCEKFYSISSIGVEIQPDIEASNDNSQTLICLV